MDPQHSNCSGLGLCAVDPAQARIITTLPSLPSRRSHPTTFNSQPSTTHSDFADHPQTTQTTQTIHISREILDFPSSIITIVPENPHSTTKRIPSPVYESFANPFSTSIHFLKRARLCFTIQFPPECKLLFPSSCSAPKPRYIWS